MAQEPESELASAHRELRNTEFLCVAAAELLKNKWIEYGNPNYYDDPVGMYLSCGYAQSRALVDMCILNNHGSEDNLNSNSSYNLVFALNCYYKQLEIIKFLQNKIEKLQAQIDLSL